MESSSSGGRSLMDIFVKCQRVISVDQVNGRREERATLNSRNDLLSYTSPARLRLVLAILDKLTRLITSSL